MHKRKRISTDFVSTPATNPLIPGLTFRSELLKPRPSQISQYSDLVSERIGRLDQHAQILGEGFGIPSGPFELNPVPDPVGTNSAAVTIAILRTLVARTEWVTLEKRAGRWGLYFTRGAALIGQDRSSETVPLRDAPLDIREKFLLRSIEFFQEYLKRCEERLGRMRASVESADQAIDSLNQVRLT